MSSPFAGGLFEDREEVTLAFGPRGGELPDHLLGVLFVLEVHYRVLGLILCKVVGVAF